MRCLLPLLILLGCTPAGTLEPTPAPPSDPTPEPTPPTVWPQVIVNEIDADADWIELFNPTEESVSLDDWGLSDDSEDPFQFVLSGDLASAGFVVSSCIELLNVGRLGG